MAIMLLLIHLLYISVYPSCKILLYVLALYFVSTDLTSESFWFRYMKMIVLIHQTETRSCLAAEKDSLLI